MKTRDLNRQAANILRGYGHEVLAEVADPKRAVTLLEEFYERQRQLVFLAVELLNGGTAPCEVQHKPGCYPFVAISLDGAQTMVSQGASYGYCRNGPGVYMTTLTRLPFFREYLIEQLTRLKESHAVDFMIGVSSEEIPVEFVVSEDELSPAAISVRAPWPRVVRRPHAAAAGDSAHSHASG